MNIFQAGLVLLSLVVGGVMSGGGHSEVEYETGEIEDCGCSSLNPDDGTSCSPWRVYTQKEFPFLCRVMQRKRFVATGVILNHKWVMSCSMFLVDEKGIEVVMDENLVSKRKEKVSEIVYPRRTVGMSKFVLLRLENSLNFPGCGNNTVCGVCLPRPMTHYYGDVLIPHYIMPLGYCEGFSSTYFMVRRARLDCCFHESRRCEVDGTVCSSDMCREHDTIGCRGVVGGPMVIRVRGRFVLISIMCDLLGCECHNPCTTSVQISHHVPFILRTIQKDD